jgi:threonine/homoserine/homoserine lactone efflux protein
MIELLVLIMIGFTVGLGGALIPGPLLAFTIFDTVRKCRVVGHYVVLGHIIWEAFIISLILLGLSNFMTQYRDYIYVVGGSVLVFMGFSMLKSGFKVRSKDSKINSSVVGGLFYTAFNPTQPPWWVSAGLALLTEGYELAGYLGITMVTLGHWLADTTYYTLISYIVSRYGKVIIPKQKIVISVLALFVAGLGTYFIISTLIKYI